MEKRAEDFTDLIEEVKEYITTLTRTDETWRIHGRGRDAPREEATPGAGHSGYGCGGLDDETTARPWRPYLVALDNVKLSDVQWQDLVAYVRARAGRLGIDVEGLRVDKPGQRVVTLVNRHGDEIGLDVHEDWIVLSGHTQCLLTDEMKQTIRETGQPEDWPYAPPNLLPEPTHHPKHTPTTPH